MRLLPLIVALTGLFAASSLLAQTPAVKPAAAKPAAAKTSKPVRAKAAPKPVEHQEPLEIDEERMAVAPRVLSGETQCEAGQRLNIEPHPSLPGRFLLKHRGINHVLTPQPTTTGVVRLENSRTGFLWLQVPIKSMLMDTKKGQRLIDNCLHPEQAAEVESMRQSAGGTP